MGDREDRVVSHPGDVPLPHVTEEVWMVRNSCARRCNSSLA